jgi:hypothetical protein
MPRAAIALLALAAALAACGEVDEAPDDAAANDEPDVEVYDDADVELDEDADVEVDEDPDLEDMRPDADLLGLSFEGLWRFEQPTEAALLLEPDAEPDTVADALADEEGIAEARVADDAEVEDRGELDVLLPPDEPAPAVVLITGEDQASAAELQDADEREEVEFAFVPTCGALAGTARHQGVEEAQAWLDDAGCEDVAIIDADTDAEVTWVAALAVEGDEVCLGTATRDGAASMCQEEPHGANGDVATLAGGFVAGFAPEDAETVEVDDGEETVTAATVVLGDAPPAYAVRPPGAHAPDAEVVDAPDIATIDVRFLDGDGDVLEEA